MFDLEYFSKNSNKKKFFIAGCDEVGRGPLAGPVVAACVAIKILNYNQLEVANFLKELHSLGIKDSKKISDKKRKEIICKFHGLSKYILDVFSNETNQKIIINYSKNICIQISIQFLSPLEIDKINILNASLEGMRRAALNVCDLSGVILIDGNKKFKSISELIELESIVKGDTKSLLIGLASIIAKDCRDHHMNELSREFPVYEWDRNAGYPTKNHLQAIKIYGITKFHRRTFKGVKEYCT